MPTHAERQILPFRPEQMFDLVYDVAKYPEFLPWCVAARVRSRTEQELVADLTIGYGPFRETFTSRAAPEGMGVLENCPGLTAEVSVRVSVGTARGFSGKRIAARTLSSGFFSELTTSGCCCEGRLARSARPTR